jgi:Zn-dependent protease with chaperone function/Tfp pilus assembly major pilin PilA
MDTVYKHETPLFVISLVISLLVWLLLILGTLGIALVYVLFFYLFYLFAHSAFISHIRGTAVRITPEQFPDLYQRITKCCEKLKMQRMPEAYLMHGNGVFNAFATRFLGRDFIVLYSDIVDALDPHPDAVDFYIGHELGHLHRKHIQWRWVLWPAAILPLLGAGYSRAREYTCDLYGLACCGDSKSAVHGLSALAAGHKRWQSIDAGQYLEQVKETGGFWMSFHELIADYPWLVKRVARVSAKDGAVDIPGRNPLAWLFAMFIPRLGIGGSPAGVLVFIAVIGILAAVALPAYQDYTTRAKMMGAVSYGNLASKAVEEYIYKNGGIPLRLEDAGVASTPPSKDIKLVMVDAKSAVVRVVLAFSPVEDKSVLYVPSMGADKKIAWRCTSQDVPAKYLPQACR